MTRETLILTTALALFGAFVLGWFTHWLLARLTRPGRAELGALDQLSQELHRAEAERDQAVALLEDTEARLGEELATARLQLSEGAAEIAELRDYIDRHITG